MEDLNINVLKGFKVKAKNIKKEKSVYICSTENGRVSIQKALTGQRNLLFQNDVKNHLYRNGFTNIDCFYMSVQGQPFFDFNNELYVMTDHVEGKNVDFSSNDDFKKIITTLALMHNLSKNMTIADDCKLYRSENLTVRYSKKAAEMVSIRKRVKKQSHLSDFDVIFLKNYDYYTNMITTALDLLEKSDFNALSQAAIDETSLCHNFLKEEYLYLKDDSIIVTNFNQCLIDTCLVDIAELIKRYIKYYDEKHLSLSEIIEIYTATNPLSQKEIEALLPLLIYPSKFIKICTQHYSKSRSWVAGAINSRINSLISKQEVTDNFIREYYKF